MTRVGKLFVVFVFGLSLFMLACSIGVYSVSVKWMMSPEEKSKLKSANAETKREILQKQAGIVDRLQDRIDELAFARDRVDYRYEQGYKSIDLGEIKRKQRQDFYQAKLNLLKTGKDAAGQAVANPVQKLEIDANREVITNLIGKDLISQRGVPLMAYQTYLESLAVANKSVQETQTAIAKAQTDYAALTDQVQGLPGNVQQPGLIKLRELQVDARLRAIAEQEFLKPFLANRYGEAVLLLKRQQALLQRKQELEKTSPVSANP
jgi:hypothetical protein